MMIGNIEKIGIVSIANKTWSSLLKDTIVGEGAEVPMNLNYEDNPHPVAPLPCARSFFFYIITVSQRKQTTTESIKL